MKKNVFQLRLTDDEKNLLESLSKRFNMSKSQLVLLALQLFASVKNDNKK